LGFTKHLCVDRVPARREKQILRHRVCFASEVSEEYLATYRGTAGMLLIAVSRAPAPVWEIHPNRQGRVKRIARKKSMPYVNHYSFHILDPEWGHVTVKICGHPPFPAQVILNGHEYVACEAKKEGIDFTKEGNCFTQMSDAAGLGRVADTLSETRAIGRLNQVCERWMYTCLSFALDSEERFTTAAHMRVPWNNPPASPPVCGAVPRNWCS